MWAIDRWVASLATVAVAAVVVVGCGDEDDAAPDIDQRDDLEQMEGNGDPARLESAAVEVLNAVAPYDALTSGDQWVVMHELTEIEEAFLRECIADRGVEASRDPEAAPVRDEAAQSMPQQFPDVERLERDGLPLLVDEGQEVIDEETGEVLLEESTGIVVPAEGEMEARQECMEEDGYESASRPVGLFFSVRSAWEDELSTITAMDEVQAELDGFSECLIAEGVAPEDSTDPDSYLAALDGAAAAETTEAGEVLMEESGKVYGRCIRDLNDLWVDVRTGDMRDEFLEEHAAAIVELSDILYGEGIEVGD